MRHLLRRLSARFTSPPLERYTAQIGSPIDPTDAVEIRLTPRQWAVIRHILIAAGEQTGDRDTHKRVVIQAIGRDLAHWAYDSSADKELFVDPRYVQVIGETLAGYVEGRVAFPDAEECEEWYIDLGEPVTPERAERTLTRLSDQTTVS